MNSAPKTRYCLFALLLLAALSAIAGPGAARSQALSAAVLYAPETNLERSELENLRTAKVSVDVAMYSFTDMEIAEELARLARAGVRVRVYRDRKEHEQEQERGLSRTDLLLAAGVQVKVKYSRELMHLKCYLIDGVLLRTGSANWSPTGLKRQDNDVRYDTDPVLAWRFKVKFEELWKRPNNSELGAR